MKRFDIMRRSDGRVVASVDESTQLGRALVADARSGSCTRRLGVGLVAWDRESKVAIYRG